MSNGVNCWKPVAILAMVISSQSTQAVGATPPAMGVAGSETRELAEAVISPRAPRGQELVQEIVRYSGENRRSGLNSQCNKCVKYLGTVRRVTHVMSLVKPAHGNVIAQETVSGTMHLLRNIERALFYGDSDLSALQFDGYEKLITDNSPATNIIDLRGQPLSEDALIDGALTVHDAPNYGQNGVAALVA